MTDATAPRSWEPLLTGDAAARARAASDDIAAALKADESLRTEDADVGVSRGAMGIALFFAARGDEDDAVELVDLAIDRLHGLGRIGPNLYMGPVGVAWGMTALEGVLLEPDEDENEVDEHVARVLGVTPWPGSFDVILGLVGLGVYALQRLPRPAARRSLELTVARLAEIAEETPTGVAWRSIPGKTLMAAERADQYTNGYFDVGLAHGSAGVVAFLAAAHAAGVDAAGDLLRRSADWLLALRLGDGASSRYPDLFGPDETPTPSRLAWCYGDPGMAVAFLAAGEALGDDALIDEARVTALACTERDLHHSGVIDGGLCHGAAGVGHVLNRVGQALGEERVLDAARRCFDELHRVRVPDTRCAGFLANMPGEDDPTTRGLEPVAGLLEGAAGIGLALEAAVGTTEPFWDPLLLLARPTRWQG